MELGDEAQSIILFGQEPVRRTLHDGRWFYSVVDTISIITESKRPRKYWSDLKAKLVIEGYAEVSEKIGHFELHAPDGKMRETDCADTETLLRIIQSIPSPKAEPFKRWLAQVGADSIEDRTEDQKRIEARDHTRIVNKRLHEEIHTRGIVTPEEHAEFEVRGQKRLYGGQSIQETREIADPGIRQAAGYSWERTTDSDTRGREPGSTGYDHWLGEHSTRRSAKSTEER